MTQLWDTEPDNDEWRDPISGYTCYIVRHPDFKSLCGYVRLPPNHCLHGRAKRAISRRVTVHGGVTYADHQGADWLVGFDCGHTHDLMPAWGGVLDQLDTARRQHGLPPLPRPDLGQTYRTFGFVKWETRSLCRQLFRLRTGVLAWRRAPRRR